MRIVIAPDSFKESLDAVAVAAAIERGIKQALPAVETVRIPMADGGEGTVQALVDATQGEIVTAAVHDPLCREIEAAWGLLGDSSTGVIEVAAASGLNLLQAGERNPLVTTSYGSGELIAEALDHGCAKILIGLGGSASNDGGAGLAQALGARLLDQQGESIGPGGIALGDLQRIDVSSMHNGIKDCEFILACDVSNPLTGPDGASRVYGPQKGADAAAVRQLDANLAHFAAVVAEQLDIAISDLHGAGAAGGIGGGCAAFLQAELKPGFEIISEFVRLDEQIANADLVITGEGCIDYQTRFGKTPYGIAQVAKTYSKPVIAIAGTLGDRYDELYACGFDKIISIRDENVNLDEAKRRAAELIEQTAARIAHSLTFNSNGTVHLSPKR